MSGTRYLTIAQRKEVILAILKGEEASAFDRNKVSDLDRAALRAAADRMVEAAARRTSPIRRYYGLRRRTPLRMGYTLSLVTALVPLATAALIAYRYRLTEVSSYPLIGAMATLFGVFSAAAGWGIASWTAHRNARTQHTINYLAARFSNKMFSDNADIFNRFFVGKRIDAELIRSLATSPDDGPREALQALRYLLNWYEFIAVGVKQGDLDYGTVYETVGSSLAFYCDRCITYISEVREKHPKILENLVDLRLAFRDH